MTPRAHAGQAGTQHLGIHQQAVIAQDIREPPAVLVVAIAVGLERDVPSAHERGQERPRLLREWRRSIEPPARLRRVDAQQSHPAHVADVERIAIHHEPDGMMVAGSRMRMTRRQRGEDRHEGGRLAGARHTDDGARYAPEPEERNNEDLPGARGLV